MSRKSLEKKIQREFPNDPLDDIHAILTDGLAAKSPARFFVAASIVIDISSGDITALKETVEHIKQDWSLLKIYRRWLDAKDRYEDGVEYLQFFATYVAPIARVAVPRLATCDSALSTLVLIALERDSDRLYIKPLLDQTAFITTDREASMQGHRIEFLDGYEGDHVELDGIPRKVAMWLDSQEQ